MELYNLNPLYLKEKIRNIQSFNTFEYENKATDNRISDS